MLSDILELINFSWCLSFGIQLVLLAYIQLFGGGVLEIRAAASCLFPSFGAKQCRHGSKDIARRALLNKVEDMLALEATREGSHY